MSCGPKPLLYIGGQSRTKEFILSLSWPIAKGAMLTVKDTIQQPLFVQPIESSHNRCVCGPQVVFDQQLAHRCITSIPETLEQTRFQWTKLHALPKRVSDPLHHSQLTYPGNLVYDMVVNTSIEPK